MRARGQRTGFCSPWSAPAVAGAAQHGRCRTGPEHSEPQPEPRRSVLGSCLLADLLLEHEISLEKTKKKIQWLMYLLSLLAPVGPASLLMPLMPALSYRNHRALALCSFDPHLCVPRCNRQC